MHTKLAESDPRALYRSEAFAEDLDLPVGPADVCRRQARRWLPLLLVSLAVVLLASGAATWLI